MDPQWSVSCANAWDSMSNLFLKGVVMIDFQRLRFNFPPTTGRPQSMTLAAVFNSRVARADAAINGFDFGFTDSDHHLFRAQVDAGTSTNGNVVNVTVNFSLRDSSGVFDDPYSGFVDVLVIADRQ
jgi:hypothetical protein